MCAGDRPFHRPASPLALRELPTAKTGATINKRLFAMTRVFAVMGNKIVLTSRREVSDKELPKPLETPKQVPDFYELVALSTAQGWTA